MTLSDALSSLGTFTRIRSSETSSNPLFLEDRSDSPLIRFIRIFSLRETMDLTEDRVADLVLSVDCDRLEFFRHAFPKEIRKTKRKRMHAKLVCHLTQDEHADLMDWAA